ncbi:MAG: HDOD domain-containing protein [Verrucomicrobia bacterium]|nr:HDOD domain-containing protein [Verrucomicrobiota bacterium]
MHTQANGPALTHPAFHDCAASGHSAKKKHLSGTDCLAFRFPGESVRLDRLEEFLGSHPDIASELRATAERDARQLQKPQPADLEAVILDLGIHNSWKLSLALAIDSCARDLEPASNTTSTEVLVLLSASVARELIAVQGSFDPELGYVCGLLRNHTRLLMKRVLRSTHSCSNNSAFDLPDEFALEKAFGVTPAEIGAWLLRSKRLPPLLEAGLVTIPSYLVTASRFSHEEELLSWTDLSMILAQAALDPAIQIGSLASRIDAVLQELSASCGLSGEDMAHIISCSARHTLRMLTQPTVSWAAPSDTHRLHNLAHPHLAP